MANKFGFGSVVVVRVAGEKKDVLIDQLFYFATWMIFVENLPILSHKVTAMLSHLIL